MTYLCVPIFVTDFDQARRDVATAIEAGAEMIELRVDRLDDPVVLQSLMSARYAVPMIVTCRPTWEGGFSEKSDEDRAFMLASGMAPAGGYVDVELKTIQRIAPEHRAEIENMWRDANVKQIISSHHFNGRPEKMYNLVKELDDSSSDVNKIVWTARTVRDNLEAFDLLVHRTKPTIALCMGEAGIISRILAKKFGGFLTFAALNREEATAPGQIDIGDMKNLYRWDSIQASTKVYGVVAHPVGHSMSPAIHNAAFNAIQYDGVYLPLLVEPHYESFKAFMESFLHFEKLDLSGLSVTIPHKEHALRYLKETGAQIDELAERIGAVNTIAISRDDGSPKLSGSNTDYAAILDSITTAAGISRDRLADLRVGVIGAGGTGRTAVAALAHYGANVLIHNRTMDRAKSLAEEFNGHRGKVAAVSLPQLDGCDVWINASSVGMHPNIDRNPLDKREPKWSSKTIVFDAVYNPIRTKFLEQAERAGAKTINGVEMFVRQAAGQFELWTGKAAPREVMRGVVEKHLAEKSR